MPPVLNMQPQDTDTTEKRSKYTVSIVGCGQRGIRWADAFADAGFTVICTDADQSLVKKLGNGKSPFSDANGESKLKGFLNSGQLCTSNELKKSVSESDIVILTLGVKFNDKKNPDYSEIQSTCKQIGASLKQGTLFIYGGVIGLGVIEGLIKETLENTSGFQVGKDFGLAYCPFNLSADSTRRSLIDEEFTVAATDKASLESAEIILKSISKNVKPVNDVKALELSTLFDIARQDINTALANELAVFCENLGMDYFSLIKLTDSQNFCPIISEGDIGNEAYLLGETAENFNVKLRLPALSRQINENMVKHAVALTQDTLHKCGKALRRARVAVLGAANLQTATEEYIKSITMKGAKVSLYDPSSKTEAYDSTPVLKKSLNETVEGTNCLVILTGQHQFKRLNIKKLRTLMKSPAVLVDLVGLAEPEKIETEGFIYCGLGRGFDKQ